MTSPTTATPTAYFDEAAAANFCAKHWFELPATASEAFIRATGERLADAAQLLASRFIALSVALRKAQTEINHLSDYLGTDEHPDFDNRHLRALIDAAREHHDRWHGSVAFRFCGHQLCHIADGDL